MKRASFIVIMTGLVIGLIWSCDPQGNPLQTTLPAGKGSTDSSPFGIVWSCGSDSLWSIFYGSNRFQTGREGVTVTEYIDGNTKKVYLASATSTVFNLARAGFVRK